jgi:hypothetical protein
VKICLPCKFAIIFNGWTEGTDHCVGIWASYNTVDDAKDVPLQLLLSICPLLADGVEGITAVHHLLHSLMPVLAIYGKDTTNVICFVGDNCNVNQRIAQTMKIPSLDVQVTNLILRSKDGSRSNPS